MADFQIHTIDLEFKKQDFGIAAYVIELPGGPVVIETGPHSTFQTLKRNIEGLGYKIQDIKHVFLTHIHLDHAGAAWCFAEAGAQIYVHPRGFIHMNDPSRLLASAKRIYKEEMDDLWGTLKAISKEQLTDVEHLEEIELEGIRLKAHHTPGHAQHHIAWQLGANLFTGDVAGVCIHGGPVIPPCPPPDIDREAWLESIAHINSLDSIERFYLGHFGEINETSAHMSKLVNTINAYVDFIEPFARENAIVENIIPLFKEFVQQYLVNSGISEKDAASYEAANPSDMSVYGLIRYWKKKIQVELDVKKLN